MTQHPTDAFRLKVLKALQLTAIDAESLTATVKRAKTAALFGSLVELRESLTVIERIGSAVAEQIEPIAGDMCDDTK